MSEQPAGGLTVNWVLAQPLRSFASKKTGEIKSVVELRDPRRLGNSIVLFVDGDVSGANLEPGSQVTVHLEAVRAGNGRGELVGEATNENLRKALVRS